MRERLSLKIAAVLLLLAAAAGAAEQEEPEDSAEEAAFLTGLDFSYWAGSEETVYGPGLTWGLILVPRLLEMGVTVGAMIGKQVYTIPIELRFSVPFALVSWLDLYPTAGPTLLFDRRNDTWEHDIAGSVGLGLEIKPPGFEWGIRLQGDYNLRLVQQIAHQGGFTVGFLYRF
jgi:hypothetical protein